MDDKTADLRDLFVETTGEEAVTESQSAARGSLSTDEGDKDAIDERLRDLVGEMADREEFDSDLPESELSRVVRAFFDPDTDDGGSDSWSTEADAALAASLSADADAEAVFRARMDLHLVAEADRDAPVPYGRLRRLVRDSSAADDPDAVLAAALPDDVDPETVHRYRRVVAAALAARRVNPRDRDAFADLLTDAEIATRLAADARRDGLEEATEDIETDVSL